MTKLSKAKIEAYAAQLETNGLGANATTYMALSTAIDFGQKLGAVSLLKQLYKLEEQHGDVVIEINAGNVRVVE